MKYAYTVFPLNRAIRISRQYLIPSLVSLYSVFTNYWIGGWGLLGKKTLIEAYCVHPV